MTGAGAQEETLFRRTNLFRSLYQFTECFINHVWYAKHITPVRTGERYPLERNFVVSIHLEPYSFVRTNIMVTS